MLGRESDSTLSTCINNSSSFVIFFFFQAEDGIRDLIVTGVQTCASSDLNDEVTRKPAQSGGFLSSKKWVIGGQTYSGPFQWAGTVDQYFAALFMPDSPNDSAVITLHRSEERRVGKECRSRWSPYH